MKKSYTLLITIVLISFFSYFSLSILETKALRSENLTNQYLYIQAKNHMSFFKEFIKDYDLKGLNHLQIEDGFFDIYANITFEDSKYFVNLYVRAKDYDVSIYEKIIKE